MSGNEQVTNRVDASLQSLCDADHLPYEDRYWWSRLSYVPSYRAHAEDPSHQPYWTRRYAAPSAPMHLRSDWGRRRIRKKSYAKVFRRCVAAETARPQLSDFAARRNHRSD